MGAVGDPGLADACSSPVTGGAPLTRDSAPRGKANANSHKGENDSNTTIVGDFNTPLSPMDRSSKMKINKETEALNDTLDQMDLIDIYRTVHPKTTEYTFFSSAHGTFSG